MEVKTERVPPLVISDFQCGFGIQVTHNEKYLSEACRAREQAEQIIARKIREAQTEINVLNNERYVIRIVLNEPWTS